MVNVKILLLAITGIGAHSAHSQSSEKPANAHYLSLQTGGMVDNYNSFGVRTFFEYQKDFKKNWQYGISYENSVHLFSAATDHPNELSTNLSLLSLNGYYKINLLRDRVFWTGGLGVGAVHAYWYKNNKFGPTVNASLTLNVRITKRIYIETSPLFVLLPFHRVYYSPMNVENYDNFSAYTFFPIGIKVKL